MTDAQMESMKDAVVQRIAVNAAVDLIARRVAANALDDLNLNTEEYPDIGEDDLLLIADRITSLGVRMDPQNEKVDAAYRFLASRAGGSDD